MPQLPSFVMPFEPATIDHLGLRLYSTLPPVISEMVSNAYDAEASKVEITLPTGAIKATSEVVVRDFGHGMTPSEVQDEFLPIGRNRRGEDSANVWSKNKKVKVTGRKGLGKLSAFGVANVMEVRAVKDGYAVCLKLDYSQIKQCASGKEYKPEVVTSRTGPTTDKPGVEIRLKDLHRTKAISIDQVRRGLARRLAFIGESFEAKLNGDTIPNPGDRVLRSDCPLGFSWTIEELVAVDEIGPVEDGLQLSGWIGFLEKSAQTDRGIDIFANKKAIELNSFFSFSSTHGQFARAYLVGEIDAPFLDAEDDLAATARNSVVWESERGQKLQEWGKKALPYLFKTWAELRRKTKESAIIKTAGFDVWLSTRLEAEQRVATRMVKLLLDDDQLDTESATPLLEVIKSSVETVAFRELVEQLEEAGGDKRKLLKLFGEWRVIEAREHLKVADGRVAALDNLKKYIDEGALEVQELQPLLEKHLWIIDTSWQEIQAQSTYTQMLKDSPHFKEPKDYEDIDRRLDLWGISEGRIVTVVELKKPQKTLDRACLEQIEKYCDWMRAQLAESESVLQVRGLLVVGKLSRMADVKTKVTRLAGDDILVLTYQDLYDRAREYFNSIEKSLQIVAPEYLKSKRKKKTTS
jgi:hypothetical protein